MNLQWMVPISGAIAVLFVIYQGFDERSLTKKFATLAEARKNLPEGHATYNFLDSALNNLAKKIDRQSQPRRFSGWLLMIAKALVTLAFVSFVATWIISAGFNSTHEMDEASKLWAEITYVLGLGCAELGIALLVVGWVFKPGKPDHE